MTDYWSEEEEAFVIYYRSLGTPHRNIASLANSRFRLSRKESSYANLISKINKKAGEESRLLTVANQYPWTTVTNEQRNALNKTANGSVLYNDEQRSYAIYFFACGTPVSEIVTIFNQQFAMDVSFRNLEFLIWRTRHKKSERDELLRVAANYSWFKDPVPEDHRPLTPTRHLKKDTRASEEKATSTPNDVNSSTPLPPNDDDNLPALNSSPPPTHRTTDDAALHATPPPLNNPSSPASLSINYSPSPPPTTTYGAPRDLNPLPLTSPHSRGLDDLFDWVPLSPRFATPEPERRQGSFWGRQTPLGERRSRSPLTAGPFWFGDEEGEEEGMQG